MNPLRDEPSFWDKALVKGLGLPGLVLVAIKSAIVQAWKKPRIEKDDEDDGKTSYQ